MFSCKKAGKLISEGQDRGLTFIERISLDGHLLICRFCRQVNGNFKHMRVFVRNISHRIETGQLIGEGLSATARAKIKKKINEMEP